jgi:hypothetical protein
MTVNVEPTPISASKKPPLSLLVSAGSSSSSSPSSSSQSSFSATTVSSYFPSFRISNMIKLWPSTLSPFDSDQLTPKAGLGGQENPFEVAEPPSATQGSRTPTLIQSYHHHLLHANPPTPANLTMIPRSASADLTPQLPGAPVVPTSPGGTLALPTTHLSLHAPDFNMRQPPPPKQRKSGPDKSSTPSSSSASSSSTANSALGPSPTAAGPSKGQIHVKLIQARGLNVRSVNARPYAVVQFEQNEFVSREPTDEMDKEVKGTPINLSRNGSSSALSALAAIGSKALPDALKLAKHSGGSSPSSSGKSSFAAPNNLFGRLSAHNPVWKHEVSLCVSSCSCVLVTVSHSLQRCYFPRIAHHIQHLRSQCRRSWLPRNSSNQTRTHS